MSGLQIPASDDLEEDRFWGLAPTVTRGSARSEAARV